MYSSTKISEVVKSIRAKKMFVKYPDLKEQLWGSEFWTKGYFMSTVGKDGDEQKLRNYVKIKLQVRLPKHLNKNNGTFLGRYLVALLRGASFYDDTFMWPIIFLKSESIFSEK